MVDLFLDNYYNCAALTFVFGTLIYLANTNKCKERMGLFSFFFANLIVSLLWFITIPATLIMSFIPEKKGA